MAAEPEPDRLLKSATSSFAGDLASAETQAAGERQKNLKLLKHFCGFMLFCGATGLVLSFMELPYEERALRKHKSNSENLHEMFEVLISAGHLNATARKVLGNACELDLSPYFEPNWRFPGAFYFVVTIVTMDSDICAAFAGTIPCQPKSPRGCNTSNP